LQGDEGSFHDWFEIGLSELQGKTDIDQAG
jgi:hypothetical protein